MVLNEERGLYAERRTGYLMASWGPDWLSEPFPVPASHVDKCQAVVSLILSADRKASLQPCASDYDLRRQGAEVGLVRHER